MNSTTLTEQLVQLITDEIAFDADGLDADTDLLLTGMVDSLGVIQIVHWLEDTYEVSIDPTEITLDHFQTIRQMVVFTEAKVAEAGTAA